MGNYFDFVASSSYNKDESINTDIVITEAVDMTRDANLKYNKMIKRQYLLPKGNPVGKGNLCYLYSKDINESIHLMTQSENFMNKNNYKLYYRDFYYRGKLYNKIYNIKEREERDKDYQIISKKTNIKPIIRLNMTNGRNFYYELSKYIDIFESICGKLSIPLYISLYWNFFNTIYSFDSTDGYNKYVLVDLKKYPIGGSLKENLKNPLYMIYYTLYKYPLSFAEFCFKDITFCFFNGKSSLVFNPRQMNWVKESGVLDEISSLLELKDSKAAEITSKSLTVIKDFINKNKSKIKLDTKTYSKSLKSEMVKAMRGISTDEDINKSVDDSTIETEEIVDNVTNKFVSVMQPVISSEEITNNSQLASVSKVTDIEKAIRLDVENKANIAMKVVDKVDNAVPEKDKDQLNKDVENQVSIDIKNEINEDREKLKKIYNQTKRELPKKSEASTARDKLLKEEQKNIMVGNMKIADIEKIKAENIAVPVNDVSGTVSTINDNMKKIRYANLDKTYNEKLLKKDIVNAFLALNDKSIPMFIRDIQIEDTSDELNYKDTYTIHLEDGNRKRHTVKVDIPKFTDGQLLYLGGNKKLIKHQSFYLPVVKISPERVQVVSNYSKITIERQESKSISSVERLKKLVVGNEEIRKYFEIGNAYPNNSDFITTIEYDGISKFFVSYKMGKTHIFFDQLQASAYMKKNNIESKPDFLYIGKVDGNDTYIDINKQTTSDGKTIIDLIISTLPEALQSNYLETKAGSQLMYATANIMKKPVSVAMLLGLWEGLTTLLKKLKVNYRLEDKVPKSLAPNESWIKFKDTILVYEGNVPIDLIMNGFKKFNVGNYNIAEMDDKHPYVDYMKARYGQSNVENALMNFYEFMVDNITLEILRQLEMPTDIVNLIIYAVNLLADSRFIPEINQNLSRIRCGEVIPAILYAKLAKAYVDYRNSNGRKKYSVAQNAVIKDLLALKTVEDYSILNPTLEMDQMHAVSSKGFNGVNLDDSYTIPRRSYDPSMIGIISPSTSPDGQCGISRHLSLEPNITNLRGFTEDKWDKQNELTDVNIFCPSEMTMPIAASVDDPSRLGCFSMAEYKLF